jgi:hypothetical protein
MKLLRAKFGRVVIVLATIAICALLAVSFLCLQRARHVDVLVKVIDSDTGQSVIGAKVVVTVWSIGTNGSQPVAFTSKTGPDGEARISETAPFIVKYIGCEAAAMQPTTESMAKLVCCPWARSNQVK